MTIAPVWLQNNSSQMSCLSSSRFPTRWGKISVDVFWFIDCPNSFVVSQCDMGDLTSNLAQRLARNTFKVWFFWSCHYMTTVTVAKMLHSVDFNGLKTSTTATYGVAAGPHPANPQKLIFQSDINFNVWANVSNFVQKDLETQGGLWNECFLSSWIEMELTWHARWDVSQICWICFKCPSGK